MRRVSRQTFKFQFRDSDSEEKVTTNLNYLFDQVWMKVDDYLLICKMNKHVKVKLCYISFHFAYEINPAF